MIDSQPFLCSLTNVLHHVFTKFTSDCHNGTCLHPTLLQILFIPSNYMLHIKQFHNRDSHLLYFIVASSRPLQHMKDKPPSIHSVRPLCILYTSIKSFFTLSNLCLPLYPHPGNPSLIYLKPANPSCKVIIWKTHHTTLEAKQVFLKDLIKPRMLHALLTTFLTCPATFTDLCTQITWFLCSCTSHSSNQNA